MYKSLLEMFQDLAPHIQADMGMLQRLKFFRLGWAQKDDIYIEFLGSNLTGTYPIRFSSLDEEILYNDVFQSDIKTLTYGAHNTEGIDKRFNTISNPTYITLMYIAHLFTTSNLKKEYIEEAVKECSHIFCYKCIASLIHHYFKYDVDPSIAKAVNERLHNKYLIRKFGTWQAVFEHRSKDLLVGGIHYKRVQKFSVDDSCRILSDYQTKIRELIKNIYVVLIDVNKNNEKVKSTSLLTDTEDGIAIGDIVGSKDSYVNYIKSLVPSPVDMINEDIIDLMLTIFKSVNKKQFISLLMYVITEKSVNVNDIIEKSIIYSIDILTEQNVKGNYQRQIYNIVTYLRNGTLVVSEKLKYIKDYRLSLIPIVKKVSKKNRDTFLMNMAGMLIAYFFLRAIYK